jgi:MraZ protein
MLIGEYLIARGDKNRIALPKKLRDSLGNDDLIVTRGYEGCALLLDKQRWQVLLDSIGQSSLFHLTVRDTKRYLLGGANEIELDKQGRFVLPEYINNHIGGSEAGIVCLGVGEWIEIWNKDQWEQKSDYLSRNASDIAEKLANNK